MSEKWSLEQYRSHFKTGSKEPVKKAKYGNKKVSIEGKTFDSQKEAKRYTDLKLLHNAKEIIYLGDQISFKLPGNISYVADFVYFDYQTCSLVVEDTKSEITKKNRTYINKKKQIKDLYGITILET
jgi:hypothetical protein